MDNDLIDGIRKQLMAFPAAFKEPADLTDQERISLCIASGCEMDYRMENAADGYRMVATTKNPIGIVKVGGKFIVYENRAGVNVRGTAK